MPTRDKTTIERALEQELQLSQEQNSQLQAKIKQIEKQVRAGGAVLSPNEVTQLTQLTGEDEMLKVENEMLKDQLEMLETYNTSSSGRDGIESSVHATQRLRDPKHRVAYLARSAARTKRRYANPK